MTEKDYNEAPGVRRSELWMLKESPEKYYYFKRNPEPPTQALLFGSMVHKMVLEPRTFNKEYTLAPDVDRRTKAGREAYQAFVEQSGNKMLVSAADYEIAKQMSKAVRAHPIAKELIKGRHEVPLFFDDPDTGEHCKVRLDVLKGRKTPIVVDYKTTMNAHTDKFNQSIFRYGYSLQSYMYCQAVKVKYKLKEWPEFIIIAQEKKPPYSVNVIQLTEDVIRAGEDQFRELIGIYHLCSQTGYWYGYNGFMNQINEAYLPGWMSMGDDEED